MAGLLHTVSDTTVTGAKPYYTDGTPVFWSSQLTAKNVILIVRIGMIVQGSLLLIQVYEKEEGNKTVKDGSFIVFCKCAAFCFC